MVIYTQDREVITHINKAILIHDDVEIVTEIASGVAIVLGRYNSNEKAKAVLADIYNAYHCGNLTFVMPEN